MLPAHLIAEFWATVRQQLLENFELSRADSEKAIRLYQIAMERRQIGDLVYHRDPESVAETIALGWRKDRGFPDPESMPSVSAE